MLYYKLVMKSFFLKSFFATFSIVTLPLLHAETIDVNEDKTIDGGESYSPVEHIDYTVNHKGGKLEMTGVHVFSGASVINQTGNTELSIETAGVKSGDSLHINQSGDGTISGSLITDENGWPDCNGGTIKINQTGNGEIDLHRSPDAYTGATNFDIEQSGGGTISLDWSDVYGMGSISINQTSSSASLSIINPYISNLISSANISGSLTLGNESFGLSEPVTFDALTINGGTFKSHGAVNVASLEIIGGSLSTVSGAVKVTESLVLVVDSLDNLPVLSAAGDSLWFVEDTTLTIELSDVAIQSIQNGEELNLSSLLGEGISIIGGTNQEWDWSDVEVTSASGNYELDYTITAPEEGSGPTFTINTVTPSVPEPATATLSLLALAALAARRRRR